MMVARLQVYKYMDGRPGVGRGTGRHTLLTCVAASALSRSSRRHVFNKRLKS